MEELPRPTATGQLAQNLGGRVERQVTSGSAVGKRVAGAAPLLV